MAQSISSILLVPDTRKEPVGALWTTLDPEMAWLECCRRSGIFIECVDDQRGSIVFIWQATMISELRQDMSVHTETVCTYGYLRNDEPVVIYPAIYLARIRHAGETG